MFRSVTPARSATVTALQSSTVNSSSASCTCCVRSQMPGVGVTGSDSDAVPSVVPATRRSSKVYTVSLVSPVTVKPASFAPPSPLFGICVKFAG